MWSLVRQARYLGRYREIARVLAGYGFGLVVEQLGMAPLLSLPRRVFRPSSMTPALTVGQRLRMALIELGPTAVKLGQIISTRPDLVPPDVIEDLNRLQDTVPPFPFEVVVATIEAELGQPLDVLFREFEPVSLAAASLGQVHGAVLHTGEQVVVKVQRPDIAAAVATDLAILNNLAELAQERTPLGARYDLVDLAWEFSASLRAELDYRREGRNAERFRTNFANSPYMHIPKIYWEYTSARVLTSERLFGVKINDVAGLEAAGLDRKRLARHCTELIVQEVFVDGFFHGDPHPGNFFALSGEVVGAVDFGQVGVIDRADTAQLLLLLRAVSRHDLDATLRSLEQLGVVARYEVVPALRRDLMRFLDQVVDRSLAELSAKDTGAELLAIFQRYQLRLPAPLAMLLKAIIMMEGTGLQLDPQLDVFAVARPYVSQVAANTSRVLGEHLLAEARDVSEAVLALPHETGAVLRQLAEGTLRVQTSNIESRRVATAIAQASGRLAVAVVLGALVLAITTLSVTVALGFGGTLPFVLLILFGLGVVLTSVWLVLLLLRR